MTSKQGRFLLSNKGKRISLFTTVLILVIAGGYAYYSKVIATSQNANRSQTQTAFVQRGDLTVSASGTGTLIAQTDASFGFDTSGEVTDVYVKVGDQVQAGQVLAKMDDTLPRMKYEEAQQALQELYSAASIATVEREIATAQDTESYAREWLEYLISPEVLQAEENLAIGQQKLADAQVLVKTNPSDAANQTLQEEEQAVTFLIDKLKQAQESYKKSYLPENFGVFENIGSRRRPNMVLTTYIDPHTGEEVPDIKGPSIDDVATARNNYIQAQETVKEGKLYLDVLKTAEIPDDATGTKITTLYEAQLAVENAKSELDATQLIAPISGTVTSLGLNIGQQAGTSSAITISQLSQPYTLDVNINEADWSKAQMGNKANVTFDLLPQQTYTGTVTLVYPELNPSFETSLVHLIVQLDSSMSQELPAGTRATVDVVAGEAKGVVLVSVNAIHKGDDGKSYVPVIQNGQKVEREIEVGLQNDTYAEVKSGLEAREIVVTK